MPIDPTIALNAGKGVAQPVNFLDTALNAQNLSNLSLNNQLARSKIAAGQAYVNSLDANGNPDMNKLGINLQQNPQAAASAPQTIQEGLNAVQAHLQNQGLTLDQGIKRIQYASNQLGSLLANPADLTRKNLISRISQGVGDGVYTAKDAANLISTIPEDPAGVSQWAKAHYASAQQSIEALKPHVMMLDNGKYKLMANVNPAYGDLGYMGTVAKNEMSPAEAASPVSFVNGPQGQTVTTTLGSFASGNPKIIAAGPTTQQQQANAVLGNAQGNQAAGYIADTTNLAQTRASLQGIQAEIGQANGGPLAQKFRDIGASLGELGIKNFDQATAVDLMQKGQAQVVVSRVADGLGVPTDGKMQAITAQTPGAHMTPAAAAGAVGQLRGILDYQMAKAKTAQEAGVTQNPAISSEFNLQWQQKYPNAAIFQFHYLPQDLQKKYWSSMSDSERKSFYSQYQSAAKSGFVPTDPFSK